MTANDDILIEQFLNGDETAFAQIVSRHKQLVFQFIVSKVADMELAADLTQDVFVKLFKHANQYRGMGKFRSWLFKIAQNICIDAHRKQPKARILSLNSAEKSNEGEIEFVREIEAPDENPAAEYEAKEMKGLVDRVLASLSEKHRTAFILCQFQGLSYPEIAEIQDCPVGTVKSRIHTALTRIRDFLKENECLY